MQPREDLIAQRIVDTAYQIHRGVGPGLLEVVYEAILAHELADRGFQVERQVPVKIAYKRLHFDEGFRADLIVEDSVIVELKSIEQIHSAHKKQLLTYLRLTDKRLGLLINFGAGLFRDGVMRVVNGLPE